MPVTQELKPTRLGRLLLVHGGILAQTRCSVFVKGLTAGDSTIKREGPPPEDTEGQTHTCNEIMEVWQSMVKAYVDWLFFFLIFFFK